MGAKQTKQKIIDQPIQDMTIDQFEAVLKTTFDQHLKEQNQLKTKEEKYNNEQTKIYLDKNYLGLKSNMIESATNACTIIKYFVIPPQYQHTYTGPYAELYSNFCEMFVNHIKQNELSRLIDNIEYSFTNVGCMRICEINVTMNIDEKS